MKILIINPFSSINYLSDSFNRLSMHTTALYTHNANSLDKYVRPDPSAFDTQIYVDSDNIDNIMTSLGDKQFDYVLNGSDSSVELTDKLAQILAPLHANDLNTSLLRMNKFYMHEGLCQYGLKYIKQMIFDAQNDKIDQLLEVDISYPCFVKPLNGVGSYGVQKITSANNLIKYFTELDLALLGKKLSTFAKPENLSKYLICEYIEGSEYIVDSYSHHGKHYISSVQKYHKEIMNGVPMYRTLEIVKSSDNNWRIITEYLAKSLDAIGLNNGFAHSELFLTIDGPVLIEVNPRISGMMGFHNKLANLNGFHTQPELLAQTFTEPQLKSISYNGSKEWKILQLFNFSLAPLPDIANILYSNYSTVKEVQMLRPVGYKHNHIPNAVTDFVAVVVCGADDQLVLEQQVREILALDKEGWQIHCKVA